ncbi:hypothetical protein CHS0354_012880 [Potamilus streckersoni]|uniref:Uncharacterized protein n=1 Tax=Potamilus streckersoni TaxID=2493646 RepID=A0AAE0SW29_9BIVA|nr:hypothetical protein CHS0354_012880 [Potamilus streckersoni]
MTQNEFRFEAAYNPGQGQRIVQKRWTNRRQTNKDETPKHQSLAHLSEDQFERLLKRALLARESCHKGGQMLDVLRHEVPYNLLYTGEAIGGCTFTMKKLCYWRAIEGRIYSVYNNSV